MSAKKRSEPRTVLDRLEAERVVPVRLAAALRDLYRRVGHRKTSQLPAPGSDAELFELLLFAAMQPSSRKAREAQRRAVFMSEQRAYYQSLGIFAATDKTRKFWDVTAKTILRATRQHRAANRKRTVDRDQKLHDAFQKALQLYGGARSNVSEPHTKARRQKKR